MQTLIDIHLHTSHQHTDSTVHEKYLDDTNFFSCFKKIEAGVIASNTLYVTIKSETDIG